MQLVKRPLVQVAIAVVVVLVVAAIAYAANADLTVAALLLLVTVLAVGSLGFPAALAAAAVGFLALNWLFTEPTGSLEIERSDDVVALVVFAAAAALVGLTVQRLSTLRRSALRREDEARIRLDLTNRLLAGADVDDSLRRTADALAELFAFDACSLSTSASPPDDISVANANVRVDGPGVTLLAVAPEPLAPADRQLLEALVAGL